MSTTFSSLQIGRTGVGFAHNWLDTISHNLANSNTVTTPGEEPFRALRPVAQPLQAGPFGDNGSGVVMGAQVRQQGAAPVTYDPAHPLADEDGLVQLPVLDLNGMMVDLIVAQRHYQANVRTIQSAKEAYESALRLGAQ
jgi:flagellar basal-body rod protein FlgC